MLPYAPRLPLRERLGSTGGIGQIPFRVVNGIRMDTCSPFGMPLGHTGSPPGPTNMCQATLSSVWAQATAPPIANSSLTHHASHGIVIRVLDILDSFTRLSPLEAA